MDAMPKVSQQHRDARREQILAAARRCFLRDGFHATSKLAPPPSTAFPTRSARSGRNSDPVNHRGLNDDGTIAREGTPTETRRRALTRRVARRLVRTGFTLIMPRWGGWTSDLDRSAELFAQYYPERADQLRRAAALARTRSADPAVLLSYKAVNLAICCLLVAIPVTVTLLHHAPAGPTAVYTG